MKKVPVIVTIRLTDEGKKDMFIRDMSPPADDKYNFKILTDSPAVVEAAWFTRNSGLQIELNKYEIVEYPSCGFEPPYYEVKGKPRWFDKFPDEQEVLQILLKELDKKKVLEEEAKEKNRIAKQKWEMEQKEKEMQWKMEEERKAREKAEAERKRKEEEKKIKEAIAGWVKKYGSDAQKELLEEGYLHFDEAKNSIKEWLFQGLPRYKPLRDGDIDHADHCPDYDGVNFSSRKITYIPESKWEAFKQLRRKVFEQITDASEVKFTIKLHEAECRYCDAVTERYGVLVEVHWKGLIWFGRELALDEQSSEDD